MKFLATILLIGIFGYASFLFSEVIPWWGFVPAALIASWLIPQKVGHSFLAGFLAIAILWFFLAFRANSLNDGILSAKMAAILPLQGSSIGLILATGLVGGLLGGLGALSGAFLHKKQS